MKHTTIPAAIAALTTIAVFPAAASADQIGDGYFVGAHDGYPAVGAPTTIPLGPGRWLITITTADDHAGRATDSVDAAWLQDEEAVTVTVDGVYVGSTVDLADGVDSASSVSTFEIEGSSLTIGHATTSGWDSVHWSIDATQLVDPVPVPEPAPIVDLPVVEEPVAAIAAPVLDEPAAVIEASSITVDQPPATLPVTGPSEAVATAAVGLGLILAGWPLLGASRRARR